MTTNRTPEPEQVYRSVSGRPALYVRTEVRPGRADPEHLFVEVHDRVVFQRWVPAADGCPPEVELALDPDATGRADRLADELADEHVKTAALSAALRRAVEVVPVEVANNLRAVYREAAGRQYGSRA